MGAFTRCTFGEARPEKTTSDTRARSARCFACSTRPPGLTQMLQPLPSTRLPPVATSSSNDLTTQSHGMPHGKSTLPSREVSESPSGRSLATSPLEAVRRGRISSAILLRIGQPNARLLSWQHLVSPAIANGTPLRYLQRRESDPPDCSCYVMTSEGSMFQMIEAPSDWHKYTHACTPPGAFVFSQPILF